MRYRAALLAATLLTAACGTTHTATPTTTITPPVMRISSVEPPQTVAPTTTTTTTTVFEPDPDALCPEWHETALEAGWDEDELDRLDYVLWRESRCLPEAHNSTDPHGGSRGIAQINGFWCNPSRYNPQGWLQAQGLLQHCTDLHDPVINLTAARAIYRYAQDRGCGWSPWATRNTRWCS
jgi:hypothetical protein